MRTYSMADTQPSYEQLSYIVNHVFLPPKLPQNDDLDASKEHTLCTLVYEAAKKYIECLDSSSAGRWRPILKMLSRIHLSHETRPFSKEQISGFMQEMQPGDVLALLIREQNAGIIMRHFQDKTIFESFEVSPRPGIVMAAKGKLLCSYPGPAISVPCTTVNRPDFRHELSSFLAHMNVDVLDSAPTTRKAQSEVLEERDTAHPRYITQLLTEILRGMGQVAEVPRIRKRIADDVVWLDAFKPWRRSSMWLLIRVALQTSLHREFDGTHDQYKAFMVFAMATILRQCLIDECPSDLIFCMRAKMSKRLVKLGFTAPEFVREYVRRTGELAEVLLQARWRNIQTDQAASASWAPDRLDIDSDTHLSLTKSKPYLSQVVRGVFSAGSGYTFQPDHFRRYQDSSIFGASAGVLFTKNAHVGLFDFERAVQDHLDTWVSVNCMLSSSCSTIATCITQYYTSASSLYKSNPEAMSVMLLTIFDLWVGLDKMAVAQCPLLKEYSPEVPLGLLETLLLRRSESFKRLKLIEDYIRKRHGNAIRGRSSVFATSIRDDNFAVLYYDTSGEHHTLRALIEGDAHREKQAKLELLGRLNTEHQHLTARSNSLDHEYYVNYRGWTNHRYNCDKCSLEKQASGLSIDVFEWPLPRELLELKTVVFELLPPLPFSVWRMTTYMILRDICMPADTHPASPSVQLANYPALQQYGTAMMSQSRITLASETKSFLNSHYRSTSIPTVADRICVNNGLSFELFDNHQGEWTESFPTASIARHCTLQLPSDHYQRLQYAVDGTSHTSNIVLANQSECPRDLTLHEQIAFASLRSGPRLQWLNIARELPARSLSFGKEAVHTVLSQAVWQIGPLSSGVREWHEELSIPNFGSVLLAELQDLFTNTKSNWLEVVSMRTIIVLTSRLLASAHDPQVIERAYGLMRDVRAVTFGWMHQLAEKLQDSKDEDQVQEFQLRVCEMAASCRSTYDVDPEHAPCLLSSQDDVSVLVECAILLHDNTPPNLNGSSLDIRSLILRDQRLSHSLEELLHHLISECRDGLDRAVTAIWAGYRPGSEWQRLAQPNDRWLTTQTVVVAKQNSQSVQLNLLDGKLLVEGKPLGRLPTSITKDPIYGRILGRKILDVVPADMPGMEFATRHLISKNQVFFGLRDGTSLVIRARRDSETFELIPHLTFIGDLPSLLVNNYVHWLNLSTSTIELRPMESLWDSSSRNWRIYFSVAGRSIMCHDTSPVSAETCIPRVDTDILVDIRSPTADMISAQVAPLESRNYLIITYVPRTRSLVVHLPRFRLSFSLIQGQLECQNMPGMLIDANQSPGALFGLSSQLVLRAKDGKSRSGSRRVLIPYGHVHFQHQGFHTKIHVDTKSQTSVRYQAYTIDTDLGRLVGNVSMINRLYKIYLHAVSSHCLPDPLTGRTGTEEALNELRSAGCLSFQKLGDDEVDLLYQINSLTPSRSFYPVHLKVMQSVRWSSLAPTAQHHDFHTLTELIMEYAKSLQVFHEKTPLSNYSFEPSSVYLRKRAAHRNTLFHPEEFAGPLPAIQDDVVHASRDVSVYQDVSDECAVVDVSGMVYAWPSTLATCPQLFSVLKKLNLLEGPDDGASLSYSRDWLVPDLGMTWISLYNMCRNRTRRSDLEIVFTLSALAYGSPSNRHLIPTILAFATIPQFRHLHPPSWLSYDLSRGFQPDSTELSQIVRLSALSFECSPEYCLPRKYGEDDATLGKRRFSSFETRLDSQEAELVTRLNDQWPCEKLHPPSCPSDGSSWLFDIPGLMGRADGAFGHWYHNKELQDHIREVQAVLDRVRCSGAVWKRHSVYKFPPCPTSGPTAPCHVQFGRLLATRIAPSLNQPPIIPRLARGSPMNITPSDTNDLGHLLTEFRNSEIHPFVDYMLSQFLKGPGPNTLKAITRYRDENQRHLQETLASIRDSLSPSDNVEKILSTSGQWPRLTIRSLLGQLSFGPHGDVTKPWQNALIALAQGLVGLQLSQRLLRWAEMQNWDEFVKEVENAKIIRQDKTQNSDWLLIQADNNFLVRLIQTQVAQEMIMPSSNRNTALQLNMGEGKSSVIVPMVAAALSDGQKLVRVIVLKSLATQMFQLLVERLSGLPNRRIFYLPFSRSATLTDHQVRLIQDLYTECMRVGRVLVAQPEHILSFKLMGIDRLFCSTSAADSIVAHSLVESQHWLEKNARDILDESDEILHVRYQLVYTIGQQRSLEGHPDRWTTIQEILSLVRKHAPQVQQDFPLGIETQESPAGTYPPIRILDHKAGRALVSAIAKDVIDGELATCSFQHFSTRVRGAAVRFVTEMSVSKDDTDILAEHFYGTGSWKAVLLLRGLFVHGILEYVLKGRRWRVDYGLDQTRTLLAVPYRAKDVPSLRAEFGHPDVAIALTCFSYYYSGLSKEQLEHCFTLLYKQDNPPLEYERWTYNNHSIPEELRRLSGVNTRDPEQHEKYLFPLFHLNHATIDFFLSEVVFPKGAKECPKKLATSGWDLAEDKCHFTTGFSGTNDGRYLLPTSIIQDDPVDQLGTNARVLTFLLQSENDHYTCTHGEGEVPSAKSFLELLVKQSPKIQVLLDVGAQMLEFQNAELAKHWLTLRPDMQAVIFFDNDEPVVLMPDGNVEAFISSPFKQRLDKCLVYLDDAHTRGTDLKLPRSSRAAVTLGPKVTKDRLLQGCMRMRKLGHGQSVMFFAPLEVDRSVREAARKNASDQVNVLDILRWAMLETCADIIHHVPHWAQQGLDYARRQVAWKEFSSFPNSSAESLKSSWLQREARTLEEMYGLPAKEKGHLRHPALDVPQLHDRCENLGVLSFSDTALEEEQEREVNHEIEREQEIERPPKATAAEHQVHEHVRILVETGTITPNSSQFIFIFSPLESTTATSKRSHWSANLLATRDFSITIKGSVNCTSGEYLRPVNWIISSVSPNHDPLFVVLSPYEVNQLLPAIRKSKAVHLHQYAPRVTRSMKSFDDLAFYCIPPLPSQWEEPTLDIRNQLNLWSGQLYFRNYAAYQKLCHFLGLYTKQDTARDDIQIQNDGFIQCRRHRKSVCRFVESPVPFLKEFVSLRRKGMGYLSTPLGKMLHGRLLMDEDYD